MVELLLLSVTFLVGLAIGRWWALPVGVAVGVWAAYEIPLENVSPPHWELGAAVAAISVAAIAAGVGVRKLFARGGAPSR